MSVLCKECKALDIPRSKSQTAKTAQQSKTQQKTTTLNNRCQKEYVNLNDSSTEAAVRQPAVKWWKPRIPRCLNTQNGTLLIQPNGIKCVETPGTVLVLCYQRCMSEEEKVSFGL